MRVALCQINPTVGDFSGNVAKIKSFVAKAKKKGAQCIVFPELALCGYPPRDLLYHNAFVAKQQACIETLASFSDGCVLVCGAVYQDKHPKKSQQTLYNAGLVFQNGSLITVGKKILLPTYDVFDERRYFTAGEAPSCFDCGGEKVGLTICEDLWSEPELASTELAGKTAYSRDIAAELQSEKVDWILNLSASPYWSGKRTLRNELFCQQAKSHSLKTLMVNQVGANDDLIFDGSSVAIAESGQIQAAAPSFVEAILMVDTKTWTNEVHLVDGATLSSSGSDDASEKIDALTLGIADYFKKCGFVKCLIGVSGGADSAVVAALAVRALGAKQVKGVMMPSRFTSEESVRASQHLAKNLGIELEEISIDGAFQYVLDQLNPYFKGKPWDATEENLQARLRGLYLMALSNKENALVLSTGNKSELAVGYCTLYGDLNGGLAVVSDILKTDVYEICRSLNREREVIPQFIIDRPPSAELRANQTDQDSLPPYEVLDPILKLYIEDHRGVEEIVAQGFDVVEVTRIVGLVDRNEYKRRQMPLGLKVSRRAFGQGRRIPIAQHYRHAR